MRALTPFLAALAIISPAFAADSRDWKLHPAILDIKTMPKDLYALGDVQGDYEHLVGLLAGAKLIAPAPANPETVEWKAGPAVLVCTGNIIDGSNQSLKVIALFRTLQPLAEKAGGHIVVTLGSSEAEFLARGPSDKKTGPFIKELDAAGIAPDTIVEGSDKAGIGRWLRELPVAAKVGDWFFCHAGNTEGKKLSALETELAKQIGASGYGAPILSNPKSILQAKPVPHPWWEKDLSSKLQSIQTQEQNDNARIQRDSNNKKASKDLASARQNLQKLQNQESEVRKDMLGEHVLRNEVEGLGAKHLAFGHYAGKITFADKTTREANHMYSEFKGLVFFIDTDMGRSAGGRGYLLHAQSGSSHVVALDADGKPTTLVP